MRRIQMPNQEWQPLPGIRPIETQRIFRGVNRLDAFAIGDEFASDMSNLSSDAFPAMTVRPGYSVLGTAVGAQVLGLGVWKDTELHAVFGDGTWRRWTGASWTTLASGLNTSARWTFTNYQGNLDDINLFGSNGVDPIKRYDGLSVQNLAGAPTGGNFITHYQARLWCAVGNTLHACALDQPDKWELFEGDETDSYFIEVESPAGEMITALKSGLQKLTIGMPNAIQLLYGGVPSEFQLRPMTFDTGILNNNAADTLEGILALLDETGLYQFAGGTLPDKEFSAVVQDYITRMNAAGKTNASIGTIGQQLYVSLPVDGTTPDTVLVFDSRSDVQAWSAWRGVSVLCWARMGNQLYAGDVLGRVLQWGGTHDAGAPISWYWRSRLMTSASMAQRIRLYRLWVTVDLPVGSSLSVMFSKTEDGSGWTPVQSLTASTDLRSHRIEIPVNAAGNAQWVRIGLTGLGPATIRDLTWQARELPI